MNLFLGSGAMFDSAWNDDEVSFAQCFHPVPELHVEGAPDDHEKFVLVFVLVPDKLALEFGEPDVLAVELADHPRIPMIRKLRELFADTDLFHV